MYKKLLLTSFILTFLVYPMTQAQAGCPATTMSFERMAEEAWKATKEYANKVWDSLTEQQETRVKDAKQGNTDCSKNPKNTDKLKITTEVYDYIAKNVLDDLGDDDATEFLTPTNSYAEARQQIKDKFFYKMDTELTERGQLVETITNSSVVSGLTNLDSTVKLLEILNERQDYASAVAAKNLKIGTELRKNINKDIESIEKITTSGCNQLQGMVVENRNLSALVKSTAADLTIQILMLESLGARNLQKESPVLLAVPKKPTQTKKLGVEQ